MVHVYAASVVVSPSGTESAVAQWCTPVGCLPAGVVETVFAALGAVGVLALLALVGLTYLPDARSLVSRERERTGAERDAFAAFTERVADLDPATPRPRGEARHGAVTVGGGTPGTTTQDVRRAYRETVMALDHYEEEYDEPLAVNLGAELGPGVATAVNEEQSLSPQLRRALVEAAEGAAADREAFLDALDEEAEALADAADALEAVEAATDEEASFDDQWPFPLLAESYWQLCDLEDRCREVLQRRQERVADGEPFGGNGPDPFDFYEYLYGPLPVRHPVLAEGAEVLGRVVDVREDVVRAMAVG